VDFHNNREDFNNNKEDFNNNKEDFNNNNMVVVIKVEVINPTEVEEDITEEGEVATKDKIIIKAEVK